MEVIMQKNLEYLMQKTIFTKALKENMSNLHTGFSFMSEF